MKRFFIIRLLGILLLLFILGIVSIALFVNPNELKPRLINAVEKHTGRSLQLAGDIRWSFFPWLGLKMQAVSLGNPPGFSEKSFATFDQLAFQVKVLPLLYKQIDIAKVKIEGLKLNLIKNPKGIANWENWQAHPTQTKTKKTADKPLASAKPLTWTDFKLAGIEINEAQIRYEDQVKNTRSIVRKLQFHSGAIGYRQPASFKLRFELAPDKQVQLQAQLTLDLAAQTLDVTQLRATLDDNQLLGHLAIKKLLSRPQITAQLRSPLLKWGTLSVQHFSTDLVFADQTLQLKPLTATLYQGQYQGSLQANLKGSTPQICLESQLKSVELYALLQALKPLAYLKISGKADAVLQLRMQGQEVKHLLQTLQGQARFSVQGGAVEGVDLMHYFKVGKALIKQPSLQALQPPPTQKTPFSHLQASLTIQNGQVNNQDLLIQGAGLRMTGQGTAHLLEKQLNYQFLAQSLRKDGQPEDLVIPIRISGSFNKPRICPAVEHILVEAAKSKLLEKLAQQSKGLDLKQLWNS